MEKKGANQWQSKRKLRAVRKYRQNKTTGRQKFQLRLNYICTKFIDTKLMSRYGIDLE